MPEHDVIVVGAGNAALAAAVAAREQGAARVLVLEKAPVALRGGNTHYSGGLFRFAFSEVEDLRPLVPDAERQIRGFFQDVVPYPRELFWQDLLRVTDGRTDPELAEVLIGRSYDTVSWIAKQGIVLEPAVSLSAVRVGDRVKWSPGAVLRARHEGIGLSRTWFEIAEQRGVEIRYETSAVRLVQDAKGRVTGVTVQDADGFHDLSARAVVLGCGGFEANPEWRARYLGRPWDHAKVRGTRYNTGDGLRMAMAIGALPHGQWTGCHSTPIDADAPPYGDRKLTDKTNRLSYPYGVLVNRQGRRFFDEGEDFQFYTYAKLGGVILGEPGGVAYQIFDAKVTHLLEGRYKTGHPLVADSLEKLVAELPLDRDACTATLEAYNKAATNGAFDPTARDGLAAALALPKSNWAQRLDTPPFVAYPVTGGITFTFGGVRVDERAQVMSTSWTPIPGLYACGEMVGGLFHTNYPGGTGLMSGAVFGRLAGSHAAIEMGGSGRPPNPPPLATAPAPPGRCSIHRRLPKRRTSLALTATVYHVDLTRGSIETKVVPEDVYRRYPGGSALAAYLVLQTTPVGADPLGPDNALVMAVSPLTGLAISGQSRMTACARSPLTGAIGDSQCGGFFPAEMRNAGADAIVFTGVAKEPVYLWINDGKAELRPAKHLWGKVTADVDRLVKDELGDQKCEIAQIGPAGENLVRFAAIMNMVNRANGRTGLGAVMGSKKLKAVVVRGTKPPKPAKPEEFRGLIKRLKELQEANPGITWFGEYGTAGVLAIQDKTGGLPSMNYNEGTFEHAKAIDGATMVKTILKERDTCYACVVKCKRVVEVHDPDLDVDPVYGGPEYETLSLMGSMCGVGDLKLLAKASADANKYGMDTISCGGTIAWAMEAKAKGLLDDKGLGLAFGDGRSVIRAVEAIALREGIGDLLAEGSLRAAQSIGEAAVDLTVTAKGQEFPAHMPQHKRSLGLIYAVNPFGADHQSSEHDSMLKAKPESLQRRRLAELGDFGNMDLRDLSDDKVRFAYRTQCFYSALDTLGLCQFVWGPSWQLYGPAETVELVRAGTGWDATLEEIIEAGERRIHLLRAFNAREGIGKNADTLPKKLFTPLSGKGPTAGVAMTPEEFEHARATYYTLAGLDAETGYPTRAKLGALGLEWVADAVPAR